MEDMDDLEMSGLRPREQTPKPRSQKTNPQPLTISRHGRTTF